MKKINLLSLYAICVLCLCTHAYITFTHIICINGGFQQCLYNPASFTVAVGVSGNTRAGSCTRQLQLYSDIIKGPHYKRRFYNQTQKTIFFIFHLKKMIFLFDKRSNLNLNHALFERFFLCIGKLWLNKHIREPFRELII